MTSKPVTKTGKALKSPELKRFDMRFVRETIAELKKVVWPTRQETNNLTGIVIAVSVAMGLLLGLLDMVFYWVINTGLLGGR